MAEEIAERGQKKKLFIQGGGKTVFTADKEEQLVSWIESLRSKNLRVYEDLGARVDLPAKFINAAAYASIAGNTVQGTMHI